MSDKVQLIKEEIERRISNLEQLGDRKEIEIYFPEQFSFIKVYESLLRFIDSLPETPASTDLEEEFNRFLDEEEGVPRMWHSDEQMEWGMDIACHFAEWQRQQMMKDALDGCVTLIVKSDTSSRNLFISTSQLYKELQKYEAGDKLKIIIVKEN